MNIKTFGKKRKSLRKDTFIQAMTNIFVWIPLFGVNFLSIFTKIKFTHNVYSLIVFLFIPINSILNPIFLFLFKFSHSQKKKKEKILNKEKRLISDEKRKCL